MDKNTVKKELYKQNPKATINKIYAGKAFYNTLLDKIVEGKSSVISFEIPVEEMGETEFTPVIPAKLLIRWVMIESN